MVNTTAKDVKNRLKWRQSRNLISQTIHSGNIILFTLEPVFMYGATLWRLTKSLETKLHGIDTRMLRAKIASHGDDIQQNLSFVEASMLFL